MNNKIFKSSIAALDAETATYTGGKLNALLVYLSGTPTPAQIFITAVLRSKDENEVLINRLPLQDFVDINAILHGVDDTTTSGKTYVKIDLGCLHLDDSTLELTVENTHATLAAVCGAYGQYNFDDVDHIMTYQKTVTKVESLSNVNRIFVKGLDLADTVQIKFDGDSMFTDGYGIFTETIADYNVNDLDAADNIACLVMFDNPDNIPANVHINVVTAQSGYYLVLNQKLFVQSRVSRNTVKTAQRKIQKIKALELGDPTQARALRHAGIIPKSVTLQTAVNRAGVASSN